MSEDETPELNVEANPETSVEEGEDGSGTEIRDTDIVFDCPHCGHNLAIDYRGAGLQINCVNCGESVLVPIPNGMKIDDLDLEPGEVLKQLFATRRNLQKSETLAASLAARLEEALARVATLEAQIVASATKAEELKQLCLQQESVNAKFMQLATALAATPTGLAETDEEEGKADAE